MKEPQKIKMNDFESEQKEPIKRPLKSDNAEYLHDEFGYVTTVEIKNEDNHEDNS